MTPSPAEVVSIFMRDVRSNLERATWVLSVVATKLVDNTAAAENLAVVESACFHVRGVERRRVI